jgi:hypothetical protein
MIYLSCVSWPVPPVASDYMSASSGRVLLFNLPWASYICVLVLAHGKPVVNIILPNILTYSTTLFVHELHIEFASVPCASSSETRWTAHNFWKKCIHETSRILELRISWRKVQLVSKPLNTCIFFDKSANRFKRKFLIARYFRKCNSPTRSRNWSQLHFLKKKLQQQPISTFLRNVQLVTETGCSCIFLEKSAIHIGKLGIFWEKCNSFLISVGVAYFSRKVQVISKIVYMLL